MKIILSKLLFSCVLVVAVFLTTLGLEAKTVKLRKTQEVNFSEMNLKGTVRNPDGAYLVQKKGLKFLPLHEIQKDMDQKIRETTLFLN